LSGIKKLAGQTLWYGVPTIFTRFLSYGLSLLAFKYGARITGDLTLIYAVIPFLNVLFTYGLETSFFRYSNLKDKSEVYNTLSISIIITTLLFTILLFALAPSFVQFFHLQANPQFINWMIWILFFDTLTVIPFCKLRNDNQPRKFAFIKIANIAINVLFVLFFVVFLENWHKRNPNNIFSGIYNPNLKVGYFILGNLVASVATLFMLYKEILALRFSFNKALWKEILTYSYPLIIVGFGGMINEMLGRIIFNQVSGLPVEEAKTQIGIYGANFKLAMLITIFVQVFRMGAEPFFFSKAKDQDAKKTYARVMKFFVIACCFMYLFVVMFLRVWEKLIAYKNAEYAEGIYTVPILALSYVCLGIYYNLSVWFKLTNKNMQGAIITLIGVAITIVGNYLLIPFSGYWGSAWVELICYATMMVISFNRGQKQYRIPYAKKKLLAYIVISLILFGIHELIIYFTANSLVYYLSGILLILLFGWLIVNVERKELAKIPFINKLVK
jgi:O-antigen/teichoic acid export membrane protein